MSYFGDNVGLEGDDTAATSVLFFYSTITVRVYAGSASTVSDVQRTSNTRLLAAFVSYQRQIIS